MNRQVFKCAEWGISGFMEDIGGIGFALPVGIRANN